MKTRWLSLGDSLDKLITIWPSLIIYFDQNIIPKVQKVYEEDTEIINVNLSNISELLRDQSFSFIQVSLML